MDIVGIDQADWEANHVHTIDIWYSERRRCWVVERLNVHGDLVGAAHCCTSLQDAEACLTDWLRLHSETHLAAVRVAAKMMRSVRAGNAASVQNKDAA